MKKVQHIVRSVEKGSIAWEMEIESGDELCSINGQVITDVFDYHFLVNDEYLEVVIKKPNQEEWQLEIEKDAEEDLGITFENDFMDEYRSCSNRCIFCFIDQMPPGMRDTLYFKDDDSRLSFLQGNYVTMTNLSDKDLDRIIKYHLSPINISFHTTNPHLRCEMLCNRFAGDIFTKVQKLYDAGIEMNGQIVLCKGINDQAELERSISDLTAYLPFLRSVSVVPAGLTKYREDLYPIQKFDRQDAIAVIQQVHQWQERLFEKWGIHFVHCSDEWYILAGMDFPAEDTYDDYLQLENGVGMLRLLETEIAEALKILPGDQRNHKISIATGKLAYQFLKKYITMIQEKFSQIEVNVYPIENHFFGTQITVSGLITGKDLLEQLKGKDLGLCLLLPCNMLRAGERVLLDDVTVEQIEQTFHLPVRIVAEGGQDFLKAVLMEEDKQEHRRRQIYEQTDSSRCWTT